MKNYITQSKRTQNETRRNVSQSFFPLVPLDLAFWLAELSPAQRVRESVAFPKTERGDGELLLVVEPLPQVISPSSGSFLSSGATTERLYALSNLVQRVDLFAPLPLKNFHMENLRSSRSSFLLPSSRKTLEMARGSWYKLETLGTVEYESCIAPIQDRSDSSSVPNSGIGITKGAGICTNGGRHKLYSLNNLCNSGRHCNS